MEKAVFRTAPTRTASIVFSRRRGETVWVFAELQGFYVVRPSGADTAPDLFVEKKMLHLAGLLAHRIEKRRTVTSPDRTLHAVLVTLAGDSPGVDDESYVEITDQRGAVLASKDFLSVDGEHGWLIDKSAWTANSRFFVVQMESSGGHTPLHKPINVFLRKRGAFVSLDRTIDSVNGPFALLAPDTLKTTVIRSSPDQPEPITVTLGKWKPRIP